MADDPGRCSCPMWHASGFPAGYCCKDAFGPYIDGEKYVDGPNKGKRIDGKYSGWVPRLACPDHGGPERPDEMLEEK